MKVFRIQKEATASSPHVLASSAPRAWWQVRGTLWLALLCVCGTSVLLSATTNRRAASEASLLSPAASQLKLAAEWSGLGLGIFTVAGTAAAAILQRGRQGAAAAESFRKS